MEENTNNNKEPLKNPFQELSERDQRILKAKLLAYAIERRVKKYFQGIKNALYVR